MPQEAIRRWAGKGRWENEEYKREKTGINGRIKRKKLKTTRLEQTEKNEK